MPPPLLLLQQDDDVEDDDDVDSDSVVPGIDKLFRIKPISAWVAKSLDGGSCTMNVVKLTGTSESVACCDELL